MCSTLLILGALCRLSHIFICCQLTPFHAISKAKVPIYVKIRPSTCMSRYGLISGHEGTELS